MDAIIKDAKSRMHKSIEALRSELHKIRTGKASTAILDGIKVEYYGNMTPLNQVGNITVLDANTLAITPWDKSVVTAVEKAIYQADLGLNPVNDGTNIKVPVPPLTEERRKDYVKVVKKFGEEAKVAIRNIRRDANDTLKKKQKADNLSEDLLKDKEEEVQEITDEHIKEVEKIVEKKEEEIMEV